MKNYTSQTPVDRSISYIEKYLADFGALNISKQYENSKVKSIFFQVESMGSVVPFKLPANPEACFKVLWKEVKRPNDGTRKRIEEQSERTAWKIISDWVQIQISLIEMEQAEFMEIFLPYIAVGNGTFYQKIKDDGFKLLPDTTNK